MTSRRVVGIIGAGIAGPSFALQLLSHPILHKLYKPIIYDQRPDIQTAESEKSLHSAGAAVALSANGLYPLYQLGLKDALDSASTGHSVLKIWRAFNVESLDDDQEVRDAVPSEHLFLAAQKNIAWSQALQTNIRSIERRQLQSVLLDRVRKLGGDIMWSKKLKRIENLESGTTKLRFDDMTDVNVDLLVGADGGWSKVRRHILNLRDERATERKWRPRFMGATGFYGVASGIDGITEGDREHAADVHGIWLDQGNLSSASLPGGKMRWDLQIPERRSPELLKTSISEVEDDDLPTHNGWESKIVPSVYPRSSSIEILRRHAGVWHPITGTFGRLLANSDRIIRSPLRQRVWNEDEIQARNLVVIGDAARLMLPSSGQGSSFAVEDATILADALLNHPPSALTADGFQAALTEYARARVPRSKKMGATASWIGKLGMGETWFWRWLRDFSTRWMPVGEDLKSKGKEISSWPMELRPEIRLRDETLYTSGFPGSSQ